MNGGERKNEKMKNVSKNICDETKKNIAIKEN